MAAQSELKDEIRSIYHKRAGNYDITANLYYLIGYPEWKYRREAVAALNLQPGDTVVEIGCGTGLNFGLLQEAVGPEGRIIGVDLTDAMLEQARGRVARNDWQNVELVQADAARYTFPQGIDGVLSTLALSLIPEAGDVIRRGSEALAPGGRWVVVDLQIPNAWPSWLVTLVQPIVEPFGVVDEWIERHPWVSIMRAARESLTDVSIEERYFKTTYIISGERGETDQ